MPRKNLSKDRSIRLIEEIGQQKLIKLCDVTPGAVSLWKRRGIPFYRVQFLQAKFPRLSFWKEPAF